MSKSSALNYSQIQNLLKSKEFESLEGSFKYDVNLQKLNWLQTGGKAAALFAPKNINELQYFIKNFRYSKNILLNGLGANTIFAADNLNIVLVKIGKFANYITNNKTSLEIGAGTMSASIANYAADHAISGYEFLTTIPGTLGGNIKTNAGCYGSDVSNVIQSVTYLNKDGEIETKDNDGQMFSYRCSNFPSDAIFLSAKCAVKHGASSEIKATMDAMMAKRAETQPNSKKTAGSTFKNTTTMSAWQVIDKINMRGFQVGGLMFSPKHCNFLINFNNGNGEDANKIISKAQLEAKEKLGIDLETEAVLVKNIK